MYKVLKTYSIEKLKETIEKGRSFGGTYGMKLVDECYKELNRRRDGK